MPQPSDLANIERKVRDLGERLRRLQAEQAAWAAERLALEQALQAARLREAELAEQMGTLQARLEGQARAADPDTKALRRELDHYIREIDKCLEWLYNT